MRKTTLYALVIWILCILLSGCGGGKIPNPDKALLIPYELVLTEKTSIEQPVSNLEVEQVDVNIIKNIDKFNEWWRQYDSVNSPIAIDWNQNAVLVFEIYESQLCPVNINNFQLTTDRKNIYIFLQERLTDDDSCPSVYDTKKTMVISINNSEITEAVKLIVKTQKTHTFSKNID